MIKGALLDIINNIWVIFWGVDQFATAGPFSRIDHSGAAIRILCILTSILMADMPTVTLAASHKFKWDCTYD